MTKCNVTGQSEGILYDFYISADFGYTADYLVDERFSFNLCQDEYEKFIAQGVNAIDENMRDNYTYQYGKWFTSEQVYDLIGTFQYVPSGYYRNGHDTFTDEEEQLFWDNMDKKMSELLISERAEELSYFLGEDNE